MAFAGLMHGRVPADRSAARRGLLARMTDRLIEARAKQAEQLVAEAFARGGHEDRERLDGSVQTVRSAPARDARRANRTTFGRDVVEALRQAQALRRAMQLRYPVIDG